jgi:hypothetical protein
MELSPSRGAANSAATQEFPSISHYIYKLCALHSEKQKLQEILGRSNRLFPFIWSWLHSNDASNRFFLDAGESLSRCYLAAIRGHTDRSTVTRVQQFFYCCVCIHCRGNIFAEPLPSNERRDTYRDTDWWDGFVRDAVEMGSDITI